MTTIAQKHRIDHIDAAKGIGMMLIIASHVIPTEAIWDSKFNEIWGAVLNSFYVPLFFILSGIFEPAQFDWAKFKKRTLYLVRAIFIFAVYGFIMTGLILDKWGIYGIRNGTVIWYMIVLLYITVIWNLLKNKRHNYLYITILAIGGGIWQRQNTRGCTSANRCYACHSMPVVFGQGNG